MQHDINKIQATERDPLIMYSSQILSQALTHIYSSTQWRGAMSLTVEKSESFYYHHTKSTLKDEWMVCLPPSLVTFVSTLVSFYFSCKA